MNVKNVAIMGDIRVALSEIPKDVSHVVGRPPSYREVYTPARHSLALDPEIPIVVGSRGSGKSFWASVLTDDTVRAQVAPSYPRLRLDDVSARPGFVDQAIDAAVSRDTLDELAVDEVSTRKLWLILAIRVVEEFLGLSSSGSLASAMAIYDASEDREARLRILNDELGRRSQRIVIVFDALDRLANDWEGIRLRTSSLLETLLKLRAYKNIKFKLFLRPEQLSSVPTGFTDLSKLKAGSFDLRWSALDLYGLAYTYLANSASSWSAFQALLNNLFRESSDTIQGKAKLPVYLLRNPESQERLFVTIAGQYMGADKRRGKTYTWLPKHLADTNGRITPRSFLTALGEAARHERAPSHDHALSIEGLKHGVSEASVLRVDQLKDEYQWIDLALTPLAGQAVPCNFSAIFERWSEADTLNSIAEHSYRNRYLPPFEAAADEYDGNIKLLVALMDIGVVEIRSDQRVNIPDLFRIAALMLRRGGVPVPQY